MSQTITYYIQTSLNPELFRQAFELILGVATAENSWSIATSGNTADVYNNTDYELSQGQVNAIGEFIELTSDFSTEFYHWDDELGEFKETVSAFKEDAKRQIDEAAGKTRSKYLTSIPGQDATYIAKEVDCRAFKAALIAAAAETPPGTVSDASYAWVKAEAEATGLTSEEAADAIILQADQWRLLGSAIEKVRRSGKIEVDKKLKASTIATSLAATLAALQAL